MQRPEGKAAQREVRIENGQPEGQGTPVGAHPLHLRQLTPQGGYGLGTVLMLSFERHGTGRINGEKQCRTKIEQCKNYQGSCLQGIGRNLERRVGEKTYRPRVSNRPCISRVPGSIEE